jgi:hypothetical protein
MAIIFPLVVFYHLQQHITTQKKTATITGSGPNSLLKK